jgi:hypothetical protein
MRIVPGFSAHLPETVVGLAWPPSNTQLNNGPETDFVPDQEQKNARVMTLIQNV